MLIFKLTTIEPGWSVYEVICESIKKFYTIIYYMRDQNKKYLFWNFIFSYRKKKS